MGFVPPPLPLTKEEFFKKYATGARTLQEIDPLFYKWVNEQNGVKKFLIMAIIIVIIGGIILAERIRF